MHSSGGWQCASQDTSTRSSVPMEQHHQDFFAGFFKTPTSEAMDLETISSLSSEATLFHGEFLKRLQDALNSATTKEMRKDLKAWGKQQQSIFNARSKEIEERKAFILSIQSVGAGFDGTHASPSSKCSNFELNLLLTDDQVISPGSTSKLTSDLSLTVEDGENNHKPFMV